MQLPDPVYHNDDSENGSLERVQRRPGGQSLRSRFRQIVSMYIPSTVNEDMNFDDDHTGLLPNAERKAPYEGTEDDSPYVVRKIHDSKRIIKCMVDTVGAIITTLSGDIRRITAIAADYHAIYVCLEDLPFIFLLDLENETEYSRRYRTDSNSSCVKSYVHLHIPQIGEVVPQEICVHSPTNESTIVYVVGWIKGAPMQSETSKKWLLVKFSLHGRSIARTAVYDYQRYSGLAVDTIDNQLLLACPMLINGSKQIEEPGSRSEAALGQICKLTPNFDRRIFSVTMGSDQVNYKPEYISQLTAGSRCWASILKSAYDDESGTFIPENSVRRLFAFPGRQPTGTGKVSAREWLHIDSWDFANLNPGRIAAFDKDRLLVLDQTNGTLSYITWAKEQDTPNLHRITRPTSSPISLLCTDYVANNSYKDSASQSNAYFVSQSGIFMFKFRDNWC